MGNLFRHLFTPHHTNNHRARVLHIDALFFYAVTLVFFHFAVSYVHEKYPDVLGYATDIHVEQLLADVNNKRQAAGLSTLSLDGELSQAAANKAADMFAKGYWAHQSPDGKSPWDFIVGSGYRYVIAGENLAKNFSTSQAVVDAWMNSPSHRDNVLKPGYRDVGYAVVNGVLAGEETTLVVQMFGSRGGAIAIAPKPIVKEVSAQAPTTTPIPTIAITPAPATAPVVVSQFASATEQQPLQFGIPGFVDAFKKPLFDITAISRGVTFIFVGFLLGVLLVDAWMVARRKIVRVAGHNIAHVVFLGALLLSLTALARGVVL